MTKEETDIRNIQTRKRIKTKEKKTTVLFSDDMIIYAENPQIIAK